jgi:hypothetical protein
MTQIITRSAGPFEGEGLNPVRAPFEGEALNPGRAPFEGVAHNPVRTPVEVVHRPMLPPQPLPASLPLAGSGSLDLFLDRNNPNLHWYLPDFLLADDVDPSFAFVASQSGQQANGQPFNVARLTLRVCKQKPADVSQFIQQNPNAIVQEIPLANIAAILTSFYTDQNGQQQPRTFNASSVQDMGDSSLQLTFDGSILGDSVVVVYQDLCTFGKAVINLSASYQAWSKPGVVPPIYFRLAPMEMATRFALATPAHPLTAPADNRVEVADGEARTFSPAHVVNSSAAQTAPPPPAFIQVRQSYTKALPLGLKYNVDGYQLRYTVSTATVASHVIVNVGDLNSFNLSQSQFAELKALGDLSLQYPTLSRAYFGVVSRTIVLIPQRYSIVRTRTGCSATCLARVDSSPASGSQCLFEFSFLIAPEVSQIELVKLKQAISKIPDFNGYQLTFADFTNDTPPSTLLTSFKSGVQFAAGADAHTFAVTVSVQDDGPNTPAVADANLFILRLCSQRGTDLLGSLSLKLDDGYPNPVLASIDLNFAHTVGTDDLLAQLDEAAGTITLTNQSPLDLEIQDYALVQDASLTEFPGVINIAAAAVTSVPLPANHAGMAFVAVAQLALPASINPASMTNFLSFQTVDVQTTQYVVAVDGSGVNFVKVASIAVQITFSTLPAITPSQLNLNQAVRVDSTHIQIPLQNAVFSLPGSAKVTVSFVDTSVAAKVFTVQNEFTANPVLFLLQSDIDKQP